MATENIRDAQYFAGFFDGDGSVGCSHKKGRITRMAFYQSYDKGKPPELRAVRKRYGGVISLHRHLPGQRKSWQLRISTREGAERLLRIVSEHGIIKKPQADLGLKRLGNGISWSMLHDELARLKRNYQDVAIDSSRITLPYIAGLFTAEGCIGMHYRPRRNYYQIHSEIAQSGCPAILRAIRDKIGYGSITKGGVLKFASRQTSKFLKLIRPYMHRSQKRRQVKVLLRHFSERPGHSTTAEEKRKTARVAKKIAKLKRC